MVVLLISSPARENLGNVTHWGVCTSVDAVILVSRPVSLW